MANDLFIYIRVFCAESSEESFENESVYALKCHISQEINHLHEGLRSVSNLDYNLLFRFDFLAWKYRGGRGRERKELQYCTWTVYYYNCVILSPSFFN